MLRIKYQIIRDKKCLLNDWTLAQTVVNGDFLGEVTANWSVRWQNYWL